MVSDGTRTVTGMDTRPLIDAGLYDPDAPQAKERLELLEYLLECGATLDELVEANAAGALTVVASDLRRRGSEALLTLTELANAAGVSVDQVLAIARTRRAPDARAGRARVPPGQRPGVPHRRRGERDVR